MCRDGRVLSEFKKLSAHGVIRDPNGQIGVAPGEPSATGVANTNILPFIWKERIEFSNRGPNDVSQFLTTPLTIFIECFVCQPIKLTTLGIFLKLPIPYRGIILIEPLSKPDKFILR